MHSSLRSFAPLVVLLLAPGYSLALATPVPPPGEISAQVTVSARSQWPVPFARAVEIDQRAVELDQDRPRYLVDLAIFGEYMKRYEEIRTVLERAAVASGARQPPVDEAYRALAREMLKGEDAGAANA